MLKTLFMLFKWHYEMYHSTENVEHNIVNIHYCVVEYRVVRADVFFLTLKNMKINILCRYKKCIFSVLRVYCSMAWV